MSRFLEGRCALITGSVRGLGLAAARRLAAAGCHLVLHGFDPESPLDQLRGDLERLHGIRTMYADADLRQPEAITAMVAAATATFGAVDILVNNAVVRHAAPTEAFPVAAWDDALAVNLSAAFHTIRLTLPVMRARGWGRIINVSSIYGLRGARDRVAYVTTKTALIGLTRAVALETVADGITCNAVCPGTTETPLHDAAIAARMTEGRLSRADAEREYLAGKQPSGRLLAADDVAALFVYLCSAEASGITGASLPVDAGWSIA